MRKDNKDKPMDGCELCAWKPCDKQGVERQRCFLRDLLAGPHITEHWVNKRNTTQQQEVQHNG